MPGGPLNDAQLGLARLRITEQRQDRAALRILDDGAGIAGRARLRDDDMKAIGGQLVPDAGQASTNGERRGRRLQQDHRIGAPCALRERSRPVDSQQQEDNSRPVQATEQPPRWLIHCPAIDDDRISARAAFAYVPRGDLRK